MTQLSGAIGPLAVIALSLAWPAGSEYLPALGLPGMFRPEAGTQAWLNLHHYALSGTLLLVWLAAPRGRSADVAIALGGLAVLASAVFRAQAGLTLTILWPLTALTATALAGREPDAPAEPRRTAFGLSDPADLEVRFGPPALRAFKNIILLLAALGLTLILYHLFGLLTEPWSAGRDPLFDNREMNDHLDFILRFPWLYALGPWLPPLLLLWFSGPRPELAWVPGLGVVMLLSLGLWVEYHLESGWSGGRWMTAWSAVAGTLTRPLAWAAIAAALISLVYRRRRPGGPGSLKTWAWMGATVSLGVALTAVFLGACFHLGQTGRPAASRPEPLAARQLGPLEVGLPPDFTITANRLVLPWADGEVEVTETVLAEGGPDRPGEGRDFTEALGVPAWLRQNDYAGGRYGRRTGRPDRTRLTMDLLFPDRGLVSLSLTYAYNPREDGVRDIEALKLRRRDSFIEAAAAFLRHYRRLGPEAAAEAPFMAGWRTAGGHLSQWEGRPELHFRLSPPPVPGRGPVTLTLDYGGRESASAVRAEDGPFRAIVAYGLGLRCDRRAAEFGGRPGLSRTVLAADPPDPLYVMRWPAEFHWTADHFEALPLTLELSARPPVDRPGLIRLWEGLTQDPPSENFY